MSEEYPEDAIFKECVKDVREQFSEEEIQTIIRIYYWTKADKSPYFFENVLKKIPNTTKVIKRLKNKSLIYQVKGNGPYRITQDFVRVASYILELIDLDLLPEFKELL